MAQFVIEAENQATEDVWAAYKQAQYMTRGQVGVVYGAAVEALAKFASLTGRLEADGDLEPLAEFHAAKAAGLAGAEDDLRELIEALVAQIAGMQAALPGLFPGVPGPE